MATPLVQRLAAAASCTLIAALLAGCSTSLPDRYTEQEIAPVRHPVSEEGPARVLSTTTALLDYVGTRIRLAREPLVLFGYNCSDNGKGVISQVALCRQSLGAIASQAPNQIIVSSVMNAASWGGSAQGVPTIPPEVQVGRVLRDTTIALPSIVLDGGPVMSTPGMLVQSKSSGLSNPDVELAVESQDVLSRERETRHRRLEANAVVLAMPVVEMVPHRQCCVALV